MNFRTGPSSTCLICFDPAVALRSAARLAAAVAGAADLEAAQTTLTALGVRTELDYERDLAHTSLPAGGGDRRAPGAGGDR